MAVTIKEGTAFKDLVESNHYYLQQRDQVLHLNTNGLINILPVDFISFKEGVIAQIDSTEYGAVLLKIISDLGLKNLLMGGIIQ